MKEFSHEKAWSVKSSDISAERHAEVKALLDNILKDCPAHEGFSRQGPHRRWLQRWRSAGYNPEGNGYWNSDAYPHLALQEYSEAWDSRKSIFRPFKRGEWSPPKYMLGYYRDWSEQTTAGRDIVTFHYDAGVGNLVVGGEGFMTKELGLPDRDPAEVFIKLLKDLEQHTTHDTA